jgi:hypothetical protein
VADLFVGNEQMAEVNVEHGSVAVEIHPQRNGRPWLVDFDQLVHALQEARAQLGL